MNPSNRVATGKVPFIDKIAFGVGMLANQMFPAAMAIFKVVLVQDLGFPGWMWGILFFLPRVLDSITDQSWALFQTTPSPNGDAAGNMFLSVPSSWAFPL